MNKEKQTPALKPYMKAVSTHCKNLSKKERIEFVCEMARTVSPRKRSDFLEKFSPFRGVKKCMRNHGQRDEELGLDLKAMSEKLGFNLGFDPETDPEVLNASTKERIAETDGIADEMPKREECDDLEREEEDAELACEESIEVIKLMNRIIMDAKRRNASWIHIEPGPGKADIRVRFRTDGVCQNYNISIPYYYKAALISRIKIKFGKFEKHGNLAFKRFAPHSEDDLDFRVSIIPTYDGTETVAIRILKPCTPFHIESLGFSKENLRRFSELIAKPFGLILVCGPCESGRSTTLHSALNAISTPEKKIWTVEDTLEIIQPDLIRQIQVNPRIGFDYESAIRAILRANPDVIMLGEIRDRASMLAVTQAAMIGHLVFSALNAYRPHQAVCRCLDMGLDICFFAKVLMGILGQRLIRILCENCKQAYHPSAQEFEHLTQEYGQGDFERYKPAEYAADLILFRPGKGGCEKCNGTGYMGRIGIHELLIGTEAMKRLICCHGKPEEILKQAKKDGMRTLKQDGIEKVFLGLTDIAQIRRVCGDLYTGSG